MMCKSLDTPENYADDLGPHPHTARLKIPANLLCMDESESGEDNYVDRSVATCGQAIKNASSDAKETLMAEMSKGFSTDLARPSFSSMSDALPRTAISLSNTERVDNITSTLLTEAAEKIQPGGPAASHVPEGGDARVLVDQAKQPQQSASKASAADSLFDSRSAQSSFMRSKNAPVGALSKKMQDALSKAAAAVETHASTGVPLAEIESNSQAPSPDDDEVKTVAERMQAAMLWLNMEARLSEVKDETGKAIRARDIACSIML
jgi:hypothetical protein